MMKRWSLALMVAVVFLGNALSTPSAAREPQKDQDNHQKTVQKQQPVIEPGLDGGAVFHRYCGQCHGERYPTERIKDKWTIIATHMRVRAQLTGKETDAVLQYLQDNARQKQQALQPVSNTRKETNP